MLHALTQMEVMTVTVNMDLQEMAAIAQVNFLLISDNISMTLYMFFA